MDTPVIVSLLMFILMPIILGAAVIFKKDDSTNIVRYPKWGTVLFSFLVAFFSGLALFVVIPNDFVDPDTRGGGVLIALVALMPLLGLILNINCRIEISENHFVYRNAFRRKKNIGMTR